MKILIAVDGSKCSNHAISSVSDRLWHDGTEFLVVHVIEPVSPEYASLYVTYSTAYGQVVSERLSDARKLVKEMADILKKKLPQNAVESKVLEGPVTECLTEQVKEWQADLIVMGCHGRSGISKIVLGSVAESVLSNSPCSVEIIK